MNKLKIFKNPNKERYEEIDKAVKDNNGYCPCSIIKNQDTRCPCKEFREQDCEGECHCGKYVKVISNEES